MWSAVTVLKAYAPRQSSSTGAVVWPASEAGASDDSANFVVNGADVVELRVAGGSSQVPRGSKGDHVGIRLAWCLYSTSRSAGLLRLPLCPAWRSLVASSATRPSGRPSLLREDCGTRMLKHARRIFTAVERDSLSGRAGSTQRSGEPVAVADIAGVAAQDLARSAANTSPEARAALEEMTNARYQTKTSELLVPPAIFPAAPTQPGPGRN